MLACSKEPVELGAANYHPASDKLCAIGDRVGRGGAHDDEGSANGIRFSVRTPANYDPRVGHPLLVVYAAAGQSRRSSERFTDLTTAATAAGFVITYADHRSLSTRVLDELATIPTMVAKKWCIDADRIYLTGHSDGGTAAAAMAFRGEDGLVPTAVAPSAAGVSAVDLDAYQCPAPRPVMVLHNRDDKLFPGFGEQAALWWAQCNHCDVDAQITVAAGCVEYVGCDGDAPVRYCEGAGGHRRWPALNQVMLEFFLSN